MQQIVSRYFKGLIMQLYEKDFLQEACLIKETAAKVSESVCHGDVELLFLNRFGNIEACSDEVLDQVSKNYPLFNSICERIDDGDESVVFQAGPFSVVGSSFSAAESFLGYVFVLIGGIDRRKAVKNLDFIEIITSQISTVASMIARGGVCGCRDGVNPGVFSRMTALPIN